MVSPRSMLLAVLTLLLFVSTLSAEECRLMRFPDIHKDNIVFVYAGDLWLVSSQGGDARKLTNHPGIERYPAFSPDGKYIAFSGEYDGNTDVFVIPVEGGEPQRLTYHPTADFVADWHPDGKHVMFRSYRTSHGGAGQRLWQVSTAGGMPTPLRPPESGLATYSPDGNKIAYNRRFREARTWKRYHGGTAQDVWIYDLKNDQVERITDWKGTDNSPMWVGDKIFFNSDRDNKLDLYAYDVKTEQITKVTNHADYDVKWPSGGPGAIVYENGGYLYVLDATTGKSTKISVNVTSDLILTRPGYQNVGGLIQAFDISPDGKRAVFGARGEVLTVPAENGEIRNLTNTPGIREIFPTWSPDGKWVAYYSDRTGEYELYIRTQDGKQAEVRITKDGECYRFAAEWSPDSKKLMWRDKKYRLYYVDIDDRKPVLVDQGEYSQIHASSWSPDSKWIVYTKNNAAFYESIYLYSLASKKSERVTDDMNDDLNPVFDPDGEYLYFISLRTFNPTFSDFEQEYVYRDSRNIYMLTLEADEPSPFAPESDEVEIKEDEDEKKEDETDEEDADDDEAKEDDEDDDIEIDFAGLSERIVGLPISAAGYSNLAAVSGKIIYIARSAGENGASLRLFDLEEEEETTLLERVNGYRVSADGKKILYRAGSDYGIIDVAAKKNSAGEGALDLSNLSVKVVPRAEWAQMFDEAWRLERDFFYDPNMHGVDWPGMKKRYGQLVPYVAHRTDLTYILGELIGELATSHSYVNEGDVPEVEQVSVGLLGVDYTVDEASGRYRISKIYQGENYDSDRVSPLTQPGIDVNPGDYLLAVNGQSVVYPANIYSFFELTAGRQVVLSVNSSPSEDDAREVTVVPVASERGLRYYDWIETNRRMVDEATDGRVGYVHVPNTSRSGLNEFSRGFFAQTHKDGLIVDVRNNAGGMIPDMFIARLDRELLSLWKAREGKIGRTPQKSMIGPMACIMNEFAGSGGDAFPYYFRSKGLGPLIGNRTWGGLVGISRGIALMDGGSVTFPEFGFINVKGQWDVENYGVDPDIPIDNLPNLVAQGKDPQLDKAIEVVLRKLKESPPSLPPVPPYPIKN